MTREAIEATGRRVAGSYLQSLLDTVRGRGGCLTGLAHATSIAPSALDPLPETLPAADYVRLLDAGEQLLDDPCFGLHVGENMRLGTYNVYGLILLACRNFGDAMAQTIRYESLAHDLGRSRLVREGAESIYVWESAAPEWNDCRHLPESVFAGIAGFVRWVAQRPVPLIEVAFRHQASPSVRDECTRIFGAPVRFGAEANQARFPTALLDWPIPHAETAWLPVLTRRADELLAQRAQETSALIARVRQAIARNLADNAARLDAVAAELGMTARTLQRRLEAASTNYRDELDATRALMAERFLRDSTLPLTEIALRLGFSEQSAFTHAFRKWTGQSPLAYRQSQRAPREDGSD